MYPDEVYDTLLDAGFVVSLAGMSFVVSLAHRAIDISEVQALFGNVANIHYRQRNDGRVVVYLK